MTVHIIMKEKYREWTGKEGNSRNQRGENFTDSSDCEESGKDTAIFLGAPVIASPFPLELVTIILLPSSFHTTHSHSGSSHLTMMNFIIFLTLPSESIDTLYLICIHTSCSFPSSYLR
jgi:hypothetical protein